MFLIYNSCCQLKDIPYLKKKYLPKFNDILRGFQFLILLMKS